eukprot:jgi/Botrbrau1/17086/Bobra.0741s0001.1
MSLRRASWSSALLSITIALLVPLFVLSGHTEVPLYRESTAVSLEKGGYTNKLYFLTANVGSPGVPFKFCIDTGSSDTWVASTKCKSAGCSTLNKFDSRTSTTYVQTKGKDAGDGDLVRITYGTGDATGYPALETITLGTPPLTVKNQPIVNMMQLSEDFYQSPCDGLLGLAFPGLSSTDGLPIFYNMIDQGLLDQQLFAVWLSANTASSPAGAISFGAVNPAHYSGSIRYIPVTSRNYWKVALGGARVGGKEVAFEATQAITDTGTELTVMGQRDADRLFQDIPQVQYDEDVGLYNITTGCDDLSGLPNIELQLGGEWFSLSPTFWTTRVTVDEIGNTRPQAAQTAGDSGVVWGCVAAIAPLDDSYMGVPMRMNSIILGAPFLRAFYTVYRRNGPGDASMGFANSV